MPTDDDQAHFESLPVPLALWEPFQQCLSKHLSELTEGQIDREETFSFEAAHINAMIAVVEAEAVAAAPDLRDWLLTLSFRSSRRWSPRGYCFCYFLNAESAGLFPKRIVMSAAGES